MALLTILFIAQVTAQAQPAGLVSETVISGLNQPAGLTFSEDGRLYFWEKAGKVWIIESGVKRLLLDVSAEVLDFWDHGLLGFALDPDFNSNGYIYLLYPVDFEYLITNGDPQGSNAMGTPDVMHDTIGRLTRYTCTNPSTAPAVDLASWKILIGHWQTNPSPPHVTDGIPMCCTSHGPDTLQFAPDGTLLVSIGDGADFDSIDIGGTRSSTTSTNTAEADGILTPAERVGSFRSQLVNSYNGKVLRLDVTSIDPLLGCPGLVSNPYYDSGNPYAPASKIWAMGMRNPFRFCVRPGTGTAEAAEGDPGTIYLGDVGRNNWEELDVIPAAMARQGMANYGWPKFEGLSTAPSYPLALTANIDAPNPLFDGAACTQPFFAFNQLLIEAVDTNILTPSWPNTCNAAVQIPTALSYLHARPLFDWRHAAPQTRLPTFLLDGTASTVNIDDPASPVEGPTFSGVCSLGGVFYTGDKFPVAYHGTYFFGDCRRSWIRNLVVDESDTAVEIRNFLLVTSGIPVCMATDPAGYALYYASFTGNAIRRVAADCDDNNVGDDLDIAQGTWSDCNANGKPDPCDPEMTDVEMFVAKVLAASTDPVDLCFYDRNADVKLDGLDVKPFAEDLIAP